MSGKVNRAYLRTDRTMPLSLGTQNTLALRRLLSVVLLSFAAVAAVYFPYVSTQVNATSDGQFAQFFESVFGWSDLYLGGWPLYADPNSMSFYPLRYLFPATREAFDYFSISAPLIFAIGNAALAWELTRSRPATALAAVAAPGLGFFIAHVGHTSMLHAAAYAPWMVFACLRLAERRADWALWVALLGGSTALSLLAGHPQATVYALAASALMAAPTGAGWKQWVATYAKAGAGVVLGLGLSAVFLIPAARFVGESTRNTMTADLLRQFSLRPFELGLDVFPFLAGGYWDAGVVTSYVATDATNSWGENIAYVGVGIFSLVIVGLRGFWADPTKRKILLGLIVSLLLALAPSLPGAADVLVDVPVVSMFRAWGRWQLVSSLFALQLACIALAQLGEQRSQTRGGLASSLSSFLPWLVVPAVMATVALSPHLQGKIGAADLFRGKALVQVAILAGVGLSIFALRTRWGRGHALLVWLPIALIAGELLFLSRHATWANAYAGPATVEQTRAVAKVKGILERSDGRLLTLSGWESPHLPPDTVRAAEVPSLNWYGPLLNARFAELAGTTTGGWTRPDVLDDGNQVLDIYGVSVVEPYIAHAQPAESALNSPGSARRWTPLSSGTGALLLNSRSLPRVRLVAETVYADDAAALKALKTSVLPDGRGFQARSTALVERPQSQISGAGAIPAHKTDASGDDAFSVTFAAPTERALMLVIGDNYSRNWKAVVDGKRSAAERVNYNQIGVLVPAGARTVAVEYRDSRLLKGAAVSLIFLFAACLLVLFGCKRAKRRPSL